MTTAIVLGLMFFNLSVVVSAEDEIDDILDKEISPESQGLQAKNGPALSQREKPEYQEKSCLKKRIKFKGIWGFLDENESEGYVGGYLFRRGRVGMLKGLWNRTDNESKGKVYGFLKFGFFNGRVITPTGGKSRITGFYKINKENNTLHIRWMTPRKIGWAHCRLVLPEEVSSDTIENMGSI